MAVPWKKLAVSLALILGAATLFKAVVTLHRAGRELGAATSLIEHQTQLAFKTILLDHPVASSFELIRPAAQFSDAALFDGKLYLCGPTGILAYDRNGVLAAEYHSGQELPPAPLVRMAAGIGPAGAGPQLWIATRGAGWLAFDGHKFQQFLPESPGARALTSILPTATGRVLLGTENNGILSWNGKSLNLLHPSLADLQVTALAGTESDLWVGTVDGGVIHWHAGELERFSEAEGLPDPRVLSLSVQPEAVYIGTPAGVAEFQNGRIRRTLAAGFFANSLLVREGKLIVGTLEEGVLELPLEARLPRPRTMSESTGHGAVERIFEAGGRTYILTGEGLFDKGQLVIQPGASSLTDSNLSAIAVDQQGRLWAGFFDHGLDVLDANLEHRRHYEDEHLFCVNRIVNDSSQGVTAVATANGLVLFDASARQRQVLTKADGLIADNITDVLFRPDGGQTGMTVATPAGLTMIDRNGMSSLYAFQGLVNNHVYALAALGPKMLAGTLGGLSMLDAGAVQASYTTANSGLKQNWITAIVPVGDAWMMGTYGGGVIELDARGKWNTFVDLRGHLEINLNAMAVTPRAVYAGTSGRGLAVYSRSSRRWSFVTQGLPSENVTALAVARESLYVGTDAGLVRIAEQMVPLP